MLTAIFVFLAYLLCITDKTVAYFQGHLGDIISFLDKITGSCFIPTNFLMY